MMYSPAATSIERDGYILDTVYISSHKHYGACIAMSYMNDFFVMPCTACHTDTYAHSHASQPPIIIIYTLERIQFLMHLNTHASNKQPSIKGQDGWHVIVYI